MEEPDFKKTETKVVSDFVVDLILTITLACCLAAALFS